MKESRSPSEGRIFDEALALTSPDERAVYLKRACGSDSVLRARVEKLLAANEAASSFLEPPSNPNPTVRLADDVVAVAEKPGDIIGKYKLREKIGEGGCGEVYVADQEEPLRRRVALKIIKLGMATREVVARFEAERQALALMDHPNIAKVLDAGVTETGRPFFVMELVRGIKITDYCDQNQLSTEQRLKLFKQVCHAVQHAHQKGIIHRDIKPSNILVTLHDGVPVPKVIDFGIAKAITNQRLTDKTIYTAFEQFIGTPAYMSPEQAEMSGLDVDTRSDIYSLGVLLYELLTGRTPFDAKTLLQAGLDQMRKTIREQEPPRPSSRLSTLANADLTAVAHLRRADPLELVSLVRGDLDWIVMKALEKDRTRRYETATGFASDIHRHLCDEAILAHPPSSLYRIVKFARRNRIAFVATAAVALSLVVGCGVSILMFVKERKAHRRALVAEQEQIQLRRQAELAKVRAETRAYSSDMDLASHAANANAGLGNVQRLLAPWSTHTPDLRGWEWYHLNGLCHRDRMTIDADTNGLWAVAWSPDGKRLASAGFDTVKIWNSENGDQIAGLSGHSGGITSIAWSPDGQKLVSGGSDKTSRIWNAVDFSQVAVLKGHRSDVRCVRWNAMGDKIATAGSDGEVKVWSVVDHREILTFEASEGVTSIVWDPSGTKLAAACNQNSLRAWDTTSGTQFLKLQFGSPGPGRALTVDWSQEWLACAGDDSFIRLIDLTNGTNSILGSQDGSIMCIAGSPNGSLLASASRGADAILIWDTASHKVLRSFRGHSGVPRSLSWGPDGARIASAGLDGVIKVWDLRGDDPCIAIRHQPGQVTSVAWSPDSRKLVSGGDDGAVRIWNAERITEPVVCWHGNVVYSVGWNAAGSKFAAASIDGQISIWDALKLTELRRITTSTVRSLSWSPGSVLLASSGSEFLRIWDCRTGEEVSHSDLGGFSLAVAWSPDGRKIAVGKGRGEIVIIDPNSNIAIQKWRAHNNEVVRSLAWSANSRFLASAGDDSTARVWNAETGEEINMLYGHNSSRVNAVSWSPNGTRLATAGWDRTIRVWDPSTATENFVLGGQVFAWPEPVYTWPAFAVCWSADGTRLAFADQGGRVVVLDSSRGHLPEKESQTASLHQRKFSPK